MFLIGGPGASGRVRGRETAGTIKDLPRAKESLFLNIPYDSSFTNLYLAYIAGVSSFGLMPRATLEIPGGERRLDRILALIRSCAYSLHDLSRVELDRRPPTTPRFNMPFELGLFLGARKFGGRAQSRKKTLILDRDRFRYQAFISDIAGQDVHAYDGEFPQLIEETATWLRDEARAPHVPGGRAIAVEYARFRAALPAVAATKRLEPDELTFKDLTAISVEWILAESAGA